jgi:hypothetical protein
MSHCEAVLFTAGRVDLARSRGGARPDSYLKRH